MPNRVLDPAGVPDDSFDLFELFETVWRGRWIILVVAVLGAALGVAYSLVAREWYTSQVVLVPAESKSLPGGLGQLGSLASLAGVNIGAGGSSTQTPLAVMKSREFARQFIEEHDLLKVLLADRWDAAAGRWKHHWWSGKDPDIRDAVEYFWNRVCFVQEDKKAGLVTLSVTWRDATSSAAWANELAKRLNDRLRTQAQDEAERNIKYLQGEVAATAVPSLQQSIGKVLESEMQKLLMARGNEEFAFKVVDRAFEPKNPSAPRRVLIVAGSFLLGAALAVVALIMRKGLQERRLRKERP